LGCSRSTVDRYIAKYPTVNRAFTEERETLLDLAEFKLFEQISAGNMTAIIFALKTIGKARGYVERQEVAQSGKLEIEYVNDWRHGKD
jgi:hypothetical protein